MINPGTRVQQIRCTRALATSRPGFPRWIGDLLVPFTGEVQRLAQGDVGSFCFHPLHPKLRLKKQNTAYVERQPELRQTVRVHASASAAARQHRLR